MFCYHDDISSHVSSVRSPAGVSGVVPQWDWAHLASTRMVTMKNNDIVNTCNEIQTDVHLKV